MRHTAEHHNPAAYNYAEALLNLAREAGKLAVLAEQSRALLEILAHNHSTLRRFFEGPQIATQDKMNLIDKALGGRVDPLIVNLAKMLIRRDRVGLLRDILETYTEMAAQEQGMRSGKVLSAVALTAKEKEELSTSLEAFMKQKLVIKFEVEPGVLGGVIFQSGDELIDYSVRGRLEALRRRLTEVRV